MTPPDSGEMIGVCDLGGFPKSWPEHDNPHRPLPSCVNWEPVAVAQMEGKPDSGEREVCGTDWNVYLGPHYPCVLPRGHEGPHRAEPSVALPRYLAQRILAALEGPESPGEVADVAAELRAAVERKL